MLYTQQNTLVYTKAPAYPIGTLVNYQGTYGKVVDIYDKLDRYFYTIRTLECEVYTTVERYLSHHVV